MSTDRLYVHNVTPAGHHFADKTRSVMVAFRLYATNTSTGPEFSGGFAQPGKFSVCQSLLSVCHPPPPPWACIAFTTIDPLLLLPFFAESITFCLLGGGFSCPRCLADAVIVVRELGGPITRAGRTARPPPHAPGAFFGGGGRAGRDDREGGR